MPKGIKEGRKRLRDEEDTKEIITHLNSSGTFALVLSHSFRLEIMLYVVF
jgi:hypothetical protein